MATADFSYAQHLRKGCSYSYVLLAIFIYLFNFIYKIVFILHYPAWLLLDKQNNASVQGETKKGEERGMLKKQRAGRKKRVLLLSRQPCWEISNQILLKGSVIKSNFNPSSQTAHKSLQLSQTNDKSTLSPTCFPFRE